jgi:formate-dependent phosphoribosylglycinamide formyltransferase (GAR transformylase)
LCRRLSSRDHHAFLGLQIPAIRQYRGAAPCAFPINGDSDSLHCECLEHGLTRRHTAVRLFYKPELLEHRRISVALKAGETIDAALASAREASLRMLKDVRR